VELAHKRRRSRAVFLPTGSIGAAVQIASLQIFLRVDEIGGRSNLNIVP
jgi:hypothetical protein